MKLLHDGKFCMLFRHLLILVFQIYSFKKTYLGIPSECQIVWIKIRPDVEPLMNYIYVDEFDLCLA